MQTSGGSNRSHANALAVFVGLLALAGLIVLVGYLTSGDGDSRDDVAETSPAPTAALEIAPTSVPPTAIPPPATPDVVPTVIAPVPVADLVAVVGVPTGHEEAVIELPAANALGGNIRAGDTVTIIAYIPGQSDSVSELGAVEVLNTELAFDGAGGALLRILLAVKPRESVDLTGAIERGEIMLASGPDHDGYQAMVVELSTDRALDGNVRPGELVSIVSDGAESEALLERVRVLSVSASPMHGDDSLFGVTLAVPSSDLTILGAAIADGNISLAAS